MKFQKHIFICTNQRADGRESCGELKGFELIEFFKNKVIQNDLRVEVRAQRAGCLDVCTHGAAMVVYPEGVFYGKVEKSDIDEIFESHILNNKPVERLQIKF